ncbi:MAG: hypothetical protein JO191_09710 [Mycobacteriaceae bacterium]|nr:hypothetical protein [Mycobacteriaceae bacterium]MBV9515363.1 hypothetical protein [Mycobacteriaceae bacterium]
MLPETEATVPATRSLPFAACGVGEVPGLVGAVLALEVVGEVFEFFEAAEVGLLDDPHAATERAVAAVIARMV